MSRRKKDPLRTLTDAERQTLTQLSRSLVASAVEGARAKILLAVAAGEDYQQAARIAGWRSGDAVSWVAPRKLVHLKWKFLGKLEPGGTPEQATDRRRSDSIAEGRRP